MAGRKLLVSCIGLQAATAYHATAIGGPLRVHSRMLRSSAPRLALDTEDSKAWYALGTNIGRQLGDLKVLDAKELDSVFAGMKDIVLGNPPQIDLQEYQPKAAALFTAKQGSAAEKAESTGLAFLDDAGVDS